ncbi:phage terminase large subunit family protein [Undibacterium sp. Ji42W]|uniref:phage terminase large subunit family protein n=1 Tax=Undibacterium sp. Ji42W TaxID=3413039 RepID=UPI003BF3C5C9
MLDTTLAVRQMLSRLAKAMTPPEQITTNSWSRKHRRLSAKASALPGLYNPDLTPWIAGMHEAIDDPTVRKMVAMKSAQVAWTDGVLLNYIGRKIDVDPSPMIIMFAKQQAAKEFNDEKLIPMAEVTPRVAAKMQIHKRKDRDNRWDFKSFPGGFLKLVGSNSPSSVKSTPSPVVAVEEPDDCNDNVRDQGDTITLLEERVKTFSRSKVIFGGTPTVKGISRIDAAYQASDKRVFMVPCHECGESHVLMWENVRYSEDPDFSHEVFGHVRPESAKYVCPHCGVLWHDAEKNRNVKKAVWIATAPFYGVAGFYINELYSPFPGSTLQKLLEKFLTAQHLLNQGDDTKMRAFRNSSEGLPYEYKSDLPTSEHLSQRAEDYEEKTIPWGGFVLTAGVDVQHNRLAIIIRAWGRGMENWLVYWGEIHGQTLIENAGAWLDLDELLDSEFRHANGNLMSIRAVSVDSSDGKTTDAVYAYVRKRQGRHGRTYMAIKGASEQGKDSKEIFSKPKESVDSNKRHKPHPSGVRPYIVGTQRAKDLMIDGRLKLTGIGPGRMHWYKTVRPDYWEQLTSEIKAPHKSVKNHKVWQLKSGVRNEALDGEVYALHAAMSLKLHLLKPSHWDALDKQLRQKEIFAVDQPEKVQTSALQETAEDEEAKTPAATPKQIELPAPPPETEKKPMPKARPRRRMSGYSATNF